MHRRLVLALALTAVALSAACNRVDPEHEGLATDIPRKAKDPVYALINLGTINYTNHDIYGIYLLPIWSSNLDDAATTANAPRTAPDATAWSEQFGTGDNLAWDFRWTLPRKFKVWWQRAVTPPPEQVADTGPYDEYTHREPMPGTTWCEGEITITQPPVNAMQGVVMLHFFPDGHVEGSTNIEFDESAVKAPFSQHGKLPELVGRDCLKPIPNPFYGRKPPIKWYG